MTDGVSPFAQSLSKGELPARSVRSWFDRLTTNGRQGVSHFHDSQEVMPESVAVSATRQTIKRQSHHATEG